MGHDAGKLGFGLSGLDGSEIDEDAASGEGEGVDVLAGDDMEVEGPLLIDAGDEGRLLDKTRAELLDVARDGVVVREDGHLFVDFERNLVAFGDLLLGGEGIVAAGNGFETGEGGDCGCGEQAKGEDCVAELLVHALLPLPWT